MGYNHSRYKLHLALVEAIAEGYVRALDIITEHNTTAPSLARA